MRTLNSNTYAEIERFIRTFTDANGYAPTLDEITGGTGYPKTTVHRYVSRMREEGLLDYNGHRSISPTKPFVETSTVPILGEIACGIPKYAVENIEGYVKLPVALFGKGEFFILRAYGDSMINAGIDDGDLVLVRQQSTADDGQIVVALIDDEATLKRFYRDKRHRRFRLHPENETMEDIFVKECEIQGIAVHVIKSLE